MHPDESADSIEQRLVLAGKLKPPRLRHVMDRPRLLRLASPANKHKLVLMCAGPGYGKTTLMAQMTRFYPGRNVWYQIDGLDKDPAVFLRHLIAGVSQVCEGVGKRSLSRLEASSDAGQEGTNILGVLADEIREELETPLVICFDDFHLFYGMRFATDFLSCLIGELPSGCTVIIASRTRLRLRLGRLRSQGAVLEIGTRDLQFSMEELKELLSETWGINISEDTLPGLYRSTEGWAAGLVLIEDHLRSGDAVPEMFSGHKVKRKVYEYLVEEVLSRQSDRLRSLLKKSALIDPVDPSICQKALGVKDAPALLAKAEITNLFTTRVGDTKLYRFHPLFREILLARLKENAGENGVQEMRARFGSTFEKAGELKKAIGQYLNSNNHQKAISLIEATGTDMLKKGEHVTLGRWLDALEEMDAPLSPTMKMYRGQILLLEGKPREALKRLNGIKKLINQTDTQLQCHIAAAIAECYCMMDKPVESIKVIKRELKPTLQSKFKIELLYLLSTYYWDAYDDKNVLSCNDEIKKIAIKQNSHDQLYKADAMRANICLRNGEFPQARRLLKAIVKADDIEASQKNRYINNLASCEMMIGNYEESQILTESCIETIKKQKEPNRLIPTYDTYGCYFAAIGLWAEARRYLEESLILIHKLETNIVVTCHVKYHLGTLLRRTGKYTSALDYHTESLEIAQAFNSYYDIAISLLNLGSDLVRMGHYDDAESYFKKAHMIALERNFKYALTQIDFHRAWLNHVNGNKKQELHHLFSMLSRAKKYQHNHFIIQEGKISLQLFTTALANNIEPRFVCWLLEKIGTPSLKSIAPLVHSENKRTRIRCASLIGKLNDPSGISLARKLARDKDKEIQSLAMNALQHMRERIKIPEQILTPRENQVIEMIASGVSNKEIAERLYLSERTVKTHVTNIFRKLGFTNRLEAALYFREINEKKYNFSDS